MEGRGADELPDGIVPPYILARIKIIRRFCPACQAQPYEPCRIPTDEGLKDVRWFHLAREVDTDDQGDDCPGEQKEE